ncbi:hypothetical protein TRIUR3_32407 [Triticum urartu]|uniref:Uncharacterized protein n=1 Tax=Triticum urartu TaxID=4572 RepID=M8AJZ7_TRIUA|nr:hypothetical protein TRIUR3_32407 [Triticum urartu]
MAPWEKEAKRQGLSAVAPWRCWSPTVAVGGSSEAWRYGVRERVRGGRSVGIECGAPPCRREVGDEGDVDQSG